MRSTLYRRLPFSVGSETCAGSEDQAEWLSNLRGREMNDGGYSSCVYGHFEEHVEDIGSLKALWWMEAGAKAHKAMPV